MLIKILITSLILLGTSFSAPHVNRYYKSHKLKNEASILLTQNKYKEALSKYQESKSILDNQDINRKIQETKEIIEANTNYERGVKFIDNKKWDKAIIALSKVTKLSKHYETAKLMLDYAKEEFKNKNTPKVKEINTSNNDYKYSEENKILEPTLKPTTEIIFYSPAPTNYSTSNESSLKTSIKIALTKAAEIETQIYFLVTNRKDYYGYLDECLKDARTPKEGVILSPDQYKALEQNCHNNYDGKISSLSNQINSLDYQKQEYIRQANELLSRCTTCN
jgi:hypothetical protein